jgi:hypothetical protein
VFIQFGKRSFSRHRFLRIGDWRVSLSAFYNEALQILLLNYAQRRSAQCELRETPATSRSQACNVGRLMAGRLNWLRFCFPLLTADHRRNAVNRAYPLLTK